MNIIILDVKNRPEDNPIHNDKNGSRGSRGGEETTEHEERFLKILRSMTVDVTTDPMTYTAPSRRC